MRHRFGVIAWYTGVLLPTLGLFVFILGRAYQVPFGSPRCDLFAAAAASLGFAFGALSSGLLERAVPRAARAIDIDSIDGVTFVLVAQPLVNRVRWTLAMAFGLVGLIPASVIYVAAVDAIVRGASVPSFGGPIAFIAVFMTLAALSMTRFPTVTITTCSVSVGERSVELDASTQIAFVRVPVLSFAFGPLVELSRNESRVSFFPFVYDPGITAPARSGRGAVAIRVIASKLHATKEADRLATLFPVPDDPERGPMRASIVSPLVAVALALLALLNLAILLLGFYIKLVGL